MCSGVAVKAGNKAFPFCSQRCQLIDLGKWLDEDYRIPAEPVDPATLPKSDDSRGEDDKS
jgi:endogenous inhibitor of DNA gyrase (YacG/DUF329 family)